MKTFRTIPGVNVFETGGPDGLLRVEDGKPLATDDQRVIGILETAGAHAVTSSAAEAKTPVVDEPKSKGGE